MTYMWVEHVAIQNEHNCSLDIIYITLNIPAYFNPQGTIIRESNQSNTT